MEKHLVYGTKIDGIGDSTAHIGPPLHIVRDHHNELLKTGLWKKFEVRDWSGKDLLETLTA